jgi:mono/diheme cytochrome c family protein
MRRQHLAVLAALASLVAAARASAEDTDRVKRGEKALLGRAFNPPTFSAAGYRSVWKQWGLKERPADFERLYLERYGLHPAPYPNNGLPMGLREVPTLLGKGIATDCLACHGGSIFGKSYVGLGNTAADHQVFYEEMSQADGRPGDTPFVFSHVRGTVEAGGMAVFLLGHREPDLTFRATRIELGLRDDLVEDTPAWWLLKKKKTMYHTGGGNARSVRSLMQFMMTPLNSPAAFQRAEPHFRDIQAYLLSLEAPKYPLPIDRDLARKGEEVFAGNCARCHGTYGEKWTYPNRIVPLAEIGTDPNRHQGISEEFGRYYNRSWFAQEKGGWFGDEFTAKPSVGYQAPPLDGVWATAPYFHNGSAPTVYHVLNSKARPKLFTRSYHTDRDAYDAEKLGWKVQVIDRPLDANLPALERRKVYDTTQPGRGNGGHTFGDKLSEAERLAVIEYLKTL